MKKNVILMGGLVLVLIGMLSWFGGGEAVVDRTPEGVLQALMEGNQRFHEGRAQHPRTGGDRLRQAGREDQGDHALATVLACSDSRVPVERLFDMGVMDIFSVRVAGNVVRTNEAGSIEYGLMHVHTPVLVILGHTQCGAVTAVTRAAHGHAHPLELNIAPLVAPIGPAVDKAEQAHPDLHGDDLIPAAIEANVWQALRDLFAQSPAVRKVVKDGAVRAVGAIYDVSTGEVRWLDADRPLQILAEVEENPMRAMEIMASPGDGVGLDSEPSPRSDAFRIPAGASEPEFEIPQPDRSEAVNRTPVAHPGVQAGEPEVEQFAPAPPDAPLDFLPENGASMDVSEELLRVVPPATPEDSAAVLAQRAREAALEAARAAQAAARAANEARAAADALAQ